MQEEKRAMPEMPYSDEGQILFKIRTEGGRPGDGLARVILEEVNPRAADGVPGFPPRVPPRPPTRSLIAGFIEEVVNERGEKAARVVFDVQVSMKGGREQI
jgi:hypothetical protein